MKKYLLDYTLKVRIPVIIFAIAVTFAVTYYAAYPLWNSVGYEPVQPINFSHRLHAGEMNIDCQYCHIGVDESREASLPTVSVCMGCHTIARKDKPEVQKLTEYYNKGIPIPWKRVHRVPDFVYFNHSVHVNKGIDCKNCHGDVRNMEVIGQVKILNMGGCLDCHRNAHSKMPDLADIKNGPDNCSTCHR